MLDGVAGIEVVGEAENGLDAIAKVNELRPEVVCLDIRMPVMDGITATRRLQGSGVAVLILTAFDTEGFLLEALEAGAAGFILKDTPPAEIVAAIHRVGRGEPQFSPNVLRRLVELAGERRRPAQREAGAKLAELTDRERQVALAVADGLTNTEIGEKLYLSLPTVKTHLGRAFDKLQVTNRVQLALLVRDAEG